MEVKSHSKNSLTDQSQEEQMKISLFESRLKCDRTQEASRERLLIKQLQALREEIQDTTKDIQALRAMRQRKQKKILDNYLFLVPRELNLPATTKHLKEKVFDLSKLLDSLQEEVRLKEEQVQDLTYLIKLSFVPTSTQTRESIENECQRLSLKTREVLQVQKHYKNIRSEIKQELTQFQSRLERAESCLSVQQREMRVLKEVESEAGRRKDKVEDSLLQAQRTSHRRTSCLKAEDSARRKSTVRTKSLDIKSYRTTKDEIMWMEGGPQDNFEKDTQYLSAYEVLKKVTGLASLHDLEEHFLNQRETSLQLEGRVDNLGYKLEELDKVKGQLDEQLTSLQEEINRENNHEVTQRVTSLEEKLNSIRHDTESYRVRLASLSPLLAQIRNSLQQIHAHLHPTSPAQGEDVDDSSAGKLTDAELLEVCECTLLTLVREGHGEEMDVQALTRVYCAQIRQRKSSLIVDDSENQTAAIYTTEQDAGDSDEERQNSRGLMKKQALVMAETRSKQKSTKKQLFKI